MNPKIKAARRAGRVLRYHTTSLVQREDVAQHTFNMMNLLMIMTDGAVSSTLLKAALLHDQGEHVTGDIPSPVKRLLGEGERGALDIMEESAVNFIHHNGLPELSLWEQRLLKVADNLDGLLKCTEELRLGNLDVDQTGRTYVSYLRDSLEGLGGGTAGDMVRAAIDEFMEVAV